MLPEGYTLITSNQRQEDGYYSIWGRMTLVFSFTIPILGFTEISWALINQTSQDLSIRAWISSTPLDNLIKFNDESLNPAYPNRASRTIRIWDEFLIPPDLPYYEPDKRYALSSANTYYVNILNLQNIPNAFRLSFVDYQQITCNP